MDKECKYLKVEDVTPWHGDVFDHPEYEYYCEKKNEKLLGHFQCIRCKDFRQNAKCGTCEHFIGGGDWNLCCNIPHPTPKEKEMGMTFAFGHLCYKYTDACDMYEPKGESHVDENCSL